MQATITWFNSARGYGFIEPADGSGDIFFAAHALAPGVWSEYGPRSGEPVTFEVVDGPRGMAAARIGHLFMPGREFAG